MLQLFLEQTAASSHSGNSECTHNMFDISIPIAFQLSGCFLCFILGK